MQSWKSRVEMPSQQKEDQHACRVTRKKVHVRQMLGASRIAVFCCDVRKVASLKRRVQRWLFSGQMKNGAPLWREAHFQGKMYKTPRTRTNFGRSDVQKWHAAVAAHFQAKMYKTPHGGTDFASSDVKKWHAAVARSAFASQNAQNTTRSDQFLKVRCPKIARRCGAKHVCKSKRAKHHTLGPLFEDQMSN